MSLATPHTLHVRRLVEGARDAHNNPAKVYGDPEPWPVHGLAPGASAETAQDNRRDLSRILWTVYAPADATLPGEHDLVVLDEQEYRVEGRPDDWTRGPWEHPITGAVVELARIEG